MARILAIDYGVKRSGLAVTDPLGMIANPLETVETPALITFLQKYLETEPVACFVVGDPKNMDNTPSEVAAEVNLFVDRLEKKFPGIPVKRIDERFTSKMAQQTILAAGKNKKARRDRSLVDKVSAVIILQSFLETNLR